MVRSVAALRQLARALCGRPRALLVATLLLLAAGWFASAGGAAQSPRFLLIQPGSHESPDAAAPLMAHLADYLSIGRPEAKRLSGHYFNTIPDALAAIEQARPEFAIVTLPFYLEYRQRFDLIAQLASRPGGMTTERYLLLVAKKNPAAGWETLTGGRVAGPLCHSADAVARLMFARPSAGELPFRCEPTDRMVRAARQVAQGGLDGLLATDEQYRMLQALPVGGQLRPLYTTRPLPTSFVVSFGPPERAGHAALQRLLGMKDDPTAQKLLEELQTDGFSPFDAAFLYPITKAFDRLAPTEP